MELLVAEETVGYGTCLEVDSTSPRYLNLVPLMHQILFEPVLRRAIEPTQIIQRNSEPKRPATPAWVMPQRSTTPNHAREGYEAEQIERAAAATGRAATRPAGSTAAVTRARQCSETRANRGTGVYGERAGRLRSAACTGPPREGAAAGRYCRQVELRSRVHWLGAGGRAGDGRGAIARQHDRATPVQCERDGRFEREGDHGGHISVHRDCARADVVGTSGQTPVGHVCVRSWRGGQGHDRSRRKAGHARC